MKRGLLMLTACMLMLVILTSCAGAAPKDEGAAAMMPSPMHECADFEELMEACPDIVMNDVQTEASEYILKSVSDVSYCWISSEPVTAQIAFTFKGHEYTYRAAPCASEADMKDISGVYEEFETTEELPTNDNSMSGGYYTIQRNSDDTKGLCSWYYEPTGCQYSLWTPDGAGGDMEMETVMDYLLPIITLPDGTPIDTRY